MLSGQYGELLDQLPEGLGLRVAENGSPLNQAWMNLMPSTPVFTFSGHNVMAGGHLRTPSRGSAMC